MLPSQLEWEKWNGNMGIRPAMECTHRSQSDNGREHRLAIQCRTDGNQLTCPWSVFLEVDSGDAPRSQEEGTEPSQQLPQLTPYKPDHIQWTHHSSNVPTKENDKVVYGLFWVLKVPPHTQLTGCQDSVVSSSSSHKPHPLVQRGRVWSCCKTSCHHRTLQSPQTTLLASDELGL